MKQFLIVTSDNHSFKDFSEALAGRDQVEITWAGSLPELMNALSAGTPDLIIIDEEVDGMPGLKIARETLMKNAMLNQALVSRLSPDEFHEASEGLGIMAQLTPPPDASQADTLLDLLRKMP